MAAAATGGLGKNNKSPPPHSGWRLNKLINDCLRGDNALRYTQHINNA